MSTTENQIELDLIAKLAELKYTLRPDIRDRASLEKISGRSSKLLIECISPIVSFSVCLIPLSPQMCTMLLRNYVVSVASSEMMEHH